MTTPQVVGAARTRSAAKRQQRNAAMLSKTPEDKVETKPDGKSATETVETRRLRDWLAERVKAGAKKPSAEVVTLVPALAALLLERNPVNRPIGGHNLDILKSDVTAKRFMFNGESIVISDTGILLDGQHRCEAVIETGASIETVIVFGPKEPARYTIDIGRPKSPANFLHMKGTTDSNNVAATLGLLLRYKNQGTVQRGQVRSTKTEIVGALESFRGVQESVHLMGSTKTKHMGSRSVLAFCHYTFWKKIGREPADEFFDKVLKGENLRRGDPVYYCRERLMAMDSGYRAESRIEVIFKCWNAWRTGESLNNVKLTGILPKLVKE